uniref:D-isomer specific 2-hydroxyacid dehydrogenase NAD-binding n=1 Tax=uncultured prokaryote TaxID=198431 RepID=H5SKV3_9ZZZZ|nr:D-isomer specific 2-hydroxyacid dehydrogenase NAD-binding [uncultured prokaryote]
MAKVVATSPLPGAALRRLGTEHQLAVRSGPPLAGSQLVDFVGDAEALICLLADRVTAELFTQAKNLKVVAVYAVGVNNVDLQAAFAAGVWVTNTPDVLTDATADLTMALLLAVTRRVVEGDRFVREGRFTGWAPDLLLGAGLQGKLLGVVGFGRIGQAVARRAQAFGMRVAYFSRRPHPEAGIADAVFVPSLDELLAQADVVSLHCPLTPETRHLLSRERLFRMKSGAFLINAARGEVVDEEALVAALASGPLAGAGLDVYEHEPRVHPGLLQLPNVVLLPHLGSATRETREAMADLVVANVEAVLAGKPPVTPVVGPGLPPAP